MTNLWSETLETKEGLIRLTGIENRRVDALFSEEMDRISFRPDAKVLGALHVLCVYRARREARGA